MTIVTAYVEWRSDGGHAPDETTVNAMLREIELYAVHRGYKEAIDTRYYWGPMLQQDRFKLAIFRDYNVVEVAP